nr:class I SAM-dependent methyltransferase [Parafrankia sp. EUN1f]
MFDALLTPVGEELLARAEEALASGAELAAGTRLRAAGHPPALVAAAFSQAELRARARAKFSHPEQMFFTRPGLEQASSERAAAHRAARFAGLGRLADLCTGIGGDLLALAGEHPVLAVDRDPLHLRMAVHNATAGRGPHSGSHEPPEAHEPDRSNEVHGPHEVHEVRPWEGDVRDADLSGIDGVFVDPARREGDQRRSAGAGEPPLSWCFGLVERVAAVAVKAAPGLPLEVVPPGWEVEFVADRRGLKEAVLFSPALASAPRRATVLLGSDSAPGGGMPDASIPGTSIPGTSIPGAPGERADQGPGSGRNGEQSRLRVATLTGEPDPPGGASDADGGDGASGGGATRLALGRPEGFLFDPNPAVTRAGLVGTLARLVDGWQIDPMIAFLCAQNPVATPFARVLRVEAEMAFDVRRVAAAVRAAGISALDVRRRGLAGDVESIRRRLLPPRRQLVPGGPTMTLIMTRVRDEPWAILCTEIPDR